MMLIFSLLIFFVYLSFLVWLERGIRKARKSFSNLPPTRKHQEFSILIAAHNEEAHIGETIAGLVTQDYPREKYEIILAADRCNDRTVERAREAAGDFRNLVVLPINSCPPGISPKKQALRLARRQARFPRLILMDADVAPQPHYLDTFNRFFENGYDVVVNLVRYRFNRSWLHRYLLPERLAVRAVAIAGAGHGQALLAFGNSWAYARELPERLAGQDNLERILSGDDDLLLQRLGQLQPRLAVNLFPEGWVETRLPENWKEFFIQRRRHLSAGRHYLPRFQTGYALFHLSNLLLFLLPSVFPPATLLLALKMAADGVLLHRLARLLQEKFTLLNLLLFEPGYLLQHLILGPFSLVGKIRWR